MQLPDARKCVKSEVQCMTAADTYQSMLHWLGISQRFSQGKKPCMGGTRALL